jgi:hypothetical protein
MNPIILSLLLCFPVIYGSNPSFLATFLTEEAKALLKNNFFQPHNQSSPFYGNTRRIYCEHSTIEFNPKSNVLNTYKSYYGQVEKLTILAYAEDEHAQAILVHSTDGNESHPSTNAYPHVTISVSNVKPYTPVYSNDLWKRFVDDGIVEIKLDGHDKPRSITIKDRTSEWYGRLSSTNIYETTEAYVRIINDVIDIDGIICADNLWKNDQCQTIV